MPSGAAQKVTDVEDIVESVPTPETDQLQASAQDVCLSVNNNVFLFYVLILRVDRTSVSFRAEKCALSSF